MLFKLFIEFKYDSALITILNINESIVELKVIRTE